VVKSGKNQKRAFKVTSKKGEKVLDTKGSLGRSQFGRWQINPKEGDKKYQRIKKGVGKNLLKRITVSSLDPRKKAKTKRELGRSDKSRALPGQRGIHSYSYSLSEKIGNSRP